MDLWFVDRRNAFFVLLLGVGWDQLLDRKWMESAVGRMADFFRYCGGNQLQQWLDSEHFVAGGGGNC